MKKSIKCIVVDDEPLAIDIMKGYIAQVPQLELVGECEDAMSAFERMSQDEVDLLFLDINLPGLNGIDFIKSLSSRPAVIITTAYRDYAIESYEIDVVDYVMKPISFSRFFTAVNKYLRTVSADSDIVTAKPTSRSSIFVYSEKKNIKVYLDEIDYIESIKDYVRIHCGEERIISKDTISKYEGFLPEHFLRIHRSYIVNLDKISAYTAQDIEVGPKELPIGTSYKKKIQKILSEKG